MIGYRSLSDSDSSDLTLIQKELDEKHEWLVTKFNTESWALADFHFLLAEF